MTKEEEGEWSMEELVRMREIVGEGERVKLRIIEGDKGNIFSLEDDRGRNVLDVWRKMISLDGHNCPPGRG